MEIMRLEQREKSSPHTIESEPGYAQAPWEYFQAKKTKLLKTQRYPHILLSPSGEKMVLNGGIDTQSCNDNHCVAQLDVKKEILSRLSVLEFH